MAIVSTIIRKYWPGRERTAKPLTKFSRWADRRSYHFSENGRTTMRKDSDPTDVFRKTMMAITPTASTMARLVMYDENCGNATAISRLKADDVKMSRMARDT